MTNTNSTAVALELLHLKITMGYLAQSTFSQSPAATGLDLSAEIIVCTPYANIAEYQGTRAALEDEGVIPTGTKWPTGFDKLRWEDKQFSYGLRRERPEGAKGPRQQFLEVDWWMLRFDPINAKSDDVRNVEQKTKELAAIIHRQSARGREESKKQWNLYWAAKRDDKFQSFKNLIPGVVQPKRSHRPKNIEQSQEAAT